MAEVVQDLLDCAVQVGGVTWHRVAAVRGLGAGTPNPAPADCAVVSDGRSAGPEPGPRVRPLRELEFDELFDRPFKEKTYGMQLQEFAYHGKSIIKQIEGKLGSAQRMALTDFLRRRKQLPQMVRVLNDELRHAHLIICDELEDVWHIGFPPFFYPSEEDHESGGPGICPGGWLDLDDMFLTSRLLVCHIAELVSLIESAVGVLPSEALASRPRLRCSPPAPELRELIAVFEARVPWIGAFISWDSNCQRPSEVPVPETSSLDEVISVLDSVLTVQLQELHSDMHRAMYGIFSRICIAYARWKCTFTSECKHALQGPQETSLAGCTKTPSSQNSTENGHMNMPLAPTVILSTLD